MTHLLQDILRQPDELRRVFDSLCGEGRSALNRAAAAIQHARHIYLTGMGSSWHAAHCAGALFHDAGLPVYLQDAAELLHFGRFPEGSALVVISRSGRSVEIVNLLRKARADHATVIALTNAAEAELAQKADLVIVVPVEFDHAISVNTYTSLAAGAGVLARVSTGSLDEASIAAAVRALGETSGILPRWREQIANTRWLASDSAYYFLARGPSVGSCQETRLLWEEGVKLPATALGTSNFRHGPQEIVGKDVRFGIWIDGRRMWQEDLAVARDLRRLGSSVMVIGQNLPEDAADLVFQLPEIPPEWQFVIDIIPAQLAAERLAGLRGVDCDSFRLGAYIQEDEGGLLREAVGAPKREN